MKKLLKGNILFMIFLMLFSCSNFNPSNKFLGTWVCPANSGNIYQFYTVTISKNGEDLVLETVSGTNQYGNEKHKFVGKINGTSIEIDSFNKVSLIENGTKLLWGNIEFIKNE